MQYVLGGSLLKNSTFKLFALRSVSCFRELDIHRLNANNTPPPSPSQMNLVFLACTHVIRRPRWCTKQKQNVARV